MNKSYRLIALVITIILFATGCGTIAPKSNSMDDATSNKDLDSGNVSGKVSNNDDGEEQFKFKAEVMEAGKGLLVTPDQESNEYRSSNKISVGASDAKFTNQDSNDITMQDLKPGDILEITYNGIILESYPAQITASAIEVVDHNLIIDGYLAMIDDIYQEDEGLNSDIELLALDTTDWIELSDMEKELILTHLKKVYNLDILEGTFDELAEQGIIDKDNLYFENGIHIVISEITYDSNKKEFHYSIKKWRSGKGAIGAGDVTAVYKVGQWVIEKEGTWIS